jgi:Leucine-rich repeat (LRR) protein
MPLPINNQRSNQPTWPGLEQAEQQADTTANTAPPHHVPATGAWRVGVAAWVRSAIFSGGNQRFAREMAQREMLFQHSNLRNHPNASGELNLSRHQLNSLPPMFPLWVTHLNVAHNHLQSLRNSLPRRLECLNAGNNRLTEFPAHLPPHLQTLNLRNNRIQELPESAIRFMTNMGHHGNVDLRGNPLSPHALARLGQLRPQYTGAVVRYTGHHHGRPQNVELRPAPPVTSRLLPARQRNWAMMERILAALPPEVAMQLLQMQQDAEAAGHPIHSQQLLDIAVEHMTFGRAPVQTAQEPAYAGGILQHNLQASIANALSSAAAAWAPPALPINLANTRSPWKTFGNEHGAIQFAQFLNRLRETVNADEPAFRQGVAQWLKQLENDPKLREDTFAVSVGATETCEDRISLTYNTMRKLSMAAEVSSGKYDQRLPELIGLARGMFRLEQLETIAHETTAMLIQEHGAGRVDDVEVYLGYQVMLREPLALPVETSNMAFFACSRLNQHHLDQALARVQQTEQQEFTNYLSTEFLPWQAVIQRLAPDLYEQAQDQLIEAMGDEFTNRLANQLNALGLTNNPDAEREMGAQVRKQIAQEVYGQLSRDFLASQRMLNLLG